MTNPGAPPIENRPGFIGHAATVISLGVFYLLSPSDWYGPSWSYFYNHGLPILPAGGFGLGCCLTVSGVLQLIAVWRNNSRWLPALFFVSGFCFFMAGFLLGAEGLAGHHGLQEAPLLLVFGIVKFITMSNIMVERRKRGHPQ